MLVENLLIGLYAELIFELELVVCFVIVLVAFDIGGNLLGYQLL